MKFEPGKKYKYQFDGAVYSCVGINLRGEAIFQRSPEGGLFNLNRFGNQDSGWTEVPSPQEFWIHLPTRIAFNKKAHALEFTVGHDFDLVHVKEVLDLKEQI